MIEIKEIEVQKLKINPGDFLAITVKSSNISDSDVESLISHLKTVFPNNKVMVHLLQPEDTIEYSVVSSEAPKTCADCNCGKQGECNGS